MLVWPLRAATGLGSPRRCQMPGDRVRTADALLFATLPGKCWGLFCLTWDRGGNVPETLKEELWILAGSSP